MFEHLREYDHIIVSGPIRSGTRICSNIIANDLEYPLIEEHLLDIGCHDDKLSTYLWFCSRLKKSVLHQPSIFANEADVAFINSVPRSVLIVMRRDIMDILKSFRRVSLWNDKSDDDIIKL